MRALVAGLLLAAPALAALPQLEERDGDGLPEALAWGLEPISACAGPACGAAGLAAGASDEAGGDHVPDTATLEGSARADAPAAGGGAEAGLEALPGRGDLLQPTRHAGALELRAGSCASACLAAGAQSFYHQAQGAQPDVTLHGMPEGGSTGEAEAGVAPGATAGLLGASAGLPFKATMTDHGNSTVASAALPHALRPCAAGCVHAEGTAGATAAWLVLLQHERGLPHTWLGVVAPYAAECAGDTCAALAMDHTVLHHDSDDDVVHEQTRLGLADAAAMSCPLGGCSAALALQGGGGARLEDMFFIVEPPSGASGDAGLAAGAAPPLLAIPPAQLGASAAFAARDPDRDGDLDEAFVAACALGQCARVG